MSCRRGVHGGQTGRSRRGERPGDGLSGVPGRHPPLGRPRGRRDDRGTATDVHEDGAQVEGFLRAVCLPARGVAIGPEIGGWSGKGSGGDRHGAHVVEAKGGGRKTVDVHVRAPDTDLYAR